MTEVISLKEEAGSTEDTAGRIGTVLAVWRAGIADSGRGVREE